MRPTPISTPHPDFEPLMALYNATDGENWENNEGWGTDDLADLVVRR